MFQKIVRAVKRRGHKKEKPARSRNLEFLDRHITAHFGDGHTVLHEIVSSVIHIDVNVIQPSESRPYWILLTSGMSDLDMLVPDDAPFSKQIELVICLPKKWQLDFKENRWKQPEFFWPIRELKATAMYPHLCETWLGPGHTIEKEDETMVGSRFAGHMLRRPRLLPEGFDRMDTEDGFELEILALCPLLAQEIQFKLNHGSEELDKRLNAGGVTELLDPLRPSVCPVQ